MKINEIIRQKRLALGLTQEQIATILGVSTPAVNKWEKGLTYPNITLLPSLARILHTDLNTLLSFKEDLTNQEVALMMNHISEVFEEKGFEAGYQLALEKIKEYPNSDLLILNLATLLDGGLVLYGIHGDDKVYQSTIMSLYEKVAYESKDASLQEQAKSILEGMPSDHYFDKKQMLIELYLKQEKLNEAGRLTEETILAKTNEIHAYLMILMDIALKQERIEDAKSIAAIDKQASKLFDLWDYNQYVAHYQLYEALGNKKESTKVLIELLKGLEKVWDINASPLYRHIQTKAMDDSLGIMIKQRIIASIDDSDVLDEIKNTLDFK